MMKPHILVASMLFGSVVAGCFSPQYQNGNLHCTATGQCPSGYHCAVDNTCWQNGQDPQVGEDMASTMPEDMAQPPPPRDLAVGPDLAPIVVPAAAVWISSGGGSATGPASKRRLNLSLGGTPISGKATSTGGRTVTPGYFSSGK